MLAPNKLSCVADCLAGISGAGCSLKNPRRPHRLIGWIHPAEPARVKISVVATGKAKPLPGSD